MSVIQGQIGNKENFSASPLTFRLVAVSPCKALQSRRIDLAAGPTCGYLAASLHWIDVSQSEDHRKATLTGGDRVLLIVSAAGLLLLLAVAALIEPDRRGFGTHERFGLPPCSVRVLFGIRCPTCGMTTAWACLVRGRLTAALTANVGGTLLGMLAVVSLPWLLASAARGHWLVWVPNSTVVAWVASAILLATLIDWGFRLATG